MTIIVLPGVVGTSVEFERRFLPGNPSENAWSEYSYISVDTWSHGWPFEYLRRAFSLPEAFTNPVVGQRETGFLINFNYTPCMWSCPNAWQFSKHVYAFYLLILVADLLCGAAIVAASAGTCEVWRRRRKGFRFSLLDAGIAATAICSVLGWWQFHLREHTKEDAIVARMKARGSYSGPTASPTRAWVNINYHGPEWLRRLVGNPDLIPFCLHVDRLHVDSRILTADDLPDIRQLSFVEEFECVDILTPDLIDALTALPNLRSLGFTPSGYGGDGLPLARPMLDSKSLPLLSWLPGLRSVNLSEAKLTHTDLPFLASLPHFETLRVRGNDFVIEDLEPLAASPKLTLLYAEITATVEEKQSFGRAHPNLRVYWGTTYTWTGDVPTHSEPGEVAMVLINRWLAEANAEGSATNHELLDFANLRLTRARLQRLPREVFEDVGDIVLGDVDSPDTAMELINLCPKLSYLSAKHVPFTGRQIEKLAERKLLITLQLQQGEATAADFCKLAQLPELYSLHIFASTFTLPEAMAIHNAVEHDEATYKVDIFRGFDEAERDTILYEDVGNFSRQLRETTPPRKNSVRSRTSGAAGDDDNPFGNFNSK